VEDQFKKKRNVKFVTLDKGTVCSFLVIIAHVVHNVLMHLQDALNVEILLNKKEKLLSDSYDKLVLFSNFIKTIYLKKNILF
jgi:hypothetical protein